MKKLLLILGLLTPYALGQAASYSSNLTTTSTNVPAGASAPVMTVPNGLVTVCAFPGTGGPPCTNTVAIFSDQAMTQPITQPLTANPVGKFLFWAPGGTYAVYVQDSSGNNVGNYPLTLGGSGGAGNPNPPGGTLQGANQPSNAFSATGVFLTSAFQTGSGGNGATNLFTGRTNLFGLLDNNELNPVGATDTAFPVGNGNVLMNLNTTKGQMGVWGLNPVPNNNDASAFKISDAPLFTVGVQSTDSSLFARAAYAAFQGTEGQSFSRGNIGSTASTQQGWTVSGSGLDIGQILLTDGIKNGIDLVQFAPGPGDVNGFRHICIPCGYTTAGSDEGGTSFGSNVGDSTFGTTTVNTVPAPGNPTFNALSRIEVYPASSMVVDTTLASISGTITGTSSNYATGGVYLSNFGSQGSGQTNSVTYNLTSVANSVGANATYTASSTLPALTGYVCINNFTNTPTGGPNNGCYQVISNTSSTLTVNNPHAVAESNPFTTATTVFTISCSNLNGVTGFVAVTSVGGGQVGIQPTIVNPGYGGTAAPTGCTLNNPATVPPAVLATFSTTLQTPVQSLPIAGTSLTSSNTCLTLDYINAAPGPNWQTNVSSIVRCVDQNGSIPTSGFPFGMWIAGQEEPEFVKVTAATAPDSNHIQTLTISSHDPHSAPALGMQNSATTPSDLWFDANANGYNFLPTSYFWFGAGDSTHGLVGFWSKGNLANNLPLANAEPEQTVSPNNTFHAYQAAKVLYTSGRGTVPTLNYNTVPFAPADSIVVVPNPSVTVKGLGMAMTFSTPSNGGGSVGFTELIQGVHASQNFAAINPINANPFNWYKGCGAGADPQHFCYPSTPGGALGAPNMMSTVGPWFTVFNIGNPPLGAVIAVNDFAAPNYSVFSSQNSGVGNIIATSAQEELQFTGNIEVLQNTKLHDLQLPDADSGGGDVFLQTLNPTGAPGNQQLTFGSGEFTFDSIPGLWAGGFTGGLFTVGALPPIVNGVPTSGTPGTTVYCYQAVSLTKSGSSTPGAGSGNQECTVTGNATLNGTNFNNVKFGVNTGAGGMDIYRNTAPAGLLCHIPATIGSSVTCPDQGTLLTPGVNPPTTDTSGKLKLAGLISTPCLGTDATGGVVPGTCSGTPGVSAINSVTGAFTFTGSGVSCTGTTCTFSSSSGVSSFAAPSGSWPSWLVPTVTNATTTPSLAVAASAIPNSALANASTTVNGVTCTLGSTCTVSGGGGDTITTPNGSLVVGGTSTNTTLDINLAHANVFTATQSAPAFATNGSTQGAQFFGVGTGAVPTTGAPTNYVGIIGPPSGTPSYFLQLPSATPTGQVLSYATPSAVNGVSQSVPTWTTLAASATTDTTNASNIGSGTLAAGRLPTGIPIANVGSAGLSGTSPIAINSAGAISCPTCLTGTAGPSYWGIPGYYNGSNPIAPQTNELFLVGISNFPALSGLNHLVFNVEVADGTNNTAVCIYNANGTLAAHTAAATYASTGNKTVATVETNASVTAGKVYVGFTSAAATIRLGGVLNVPQVVYSNNTVVGTSGGACPASITPPTDNWVIQGAPLALGFAP